MKDKASNACKSAVRNVVFFLFSVLAKIGFGVRVHIEGDKPEGNSLFFMNHSTIFDFCFLSYALRPCKVHFVARSLEFERNKLYSWLLNTLGVIPKTQGAMDLVSVRKIVNTCRAGEPVAIYPTAMTCFDGRPGWDVLSGTGTLARMAGVNVYAAIAHGAFLSHPRFGGYNPGHVDVTIRRLFTADEAKASTPDAIQAAISEALNVNEWDWQESAKQPFKGVKSVKHLTPFLYACPACKKEDGVIVKGRHLICPACGMNAVRDKYGFFHAKQGKCPERLDQWADELIHSIQTELKSDDFALTDTVSLYKKEPSDTDYILSETGTLTMDKAGLRFAGAGDPLFWTFDSFQFFITNDKDHLQLNTPHGAFRFVLENPRYLYKWFFTHRELVLNS